TVDERRPFGEAMAIAGGRVRFVGSERGAAAFTGPRTRVIDLDGRTVIPGMVDAHAHLLGLGNALRTVDLTGTKSYDEVIARVAARAREVPAGTWILGRGWDQNDWGDTRFPSHEALSRAVPQHPVYLTRVDGHAALVNARAMAAANLAATATDPEGGRIERMANGAPSGVLVDRAMGLVNRAIPPAPRDEVRAAILAAVKEANRWGLTGIHDAGVGRATIDVYEELAKEGRYDLRNYVMIASDDANLDHYLKRGPQSALYDGRVWIRAIKISADGALGSRGAALLEPYSDSPEHSGLITTPRERIEQVAVRALRSGFQLNVHAIGDRANRTVLDAFEAALGTVPAADHRFRVEHAQILHYADIPRFAQLDVIPSMQASHQTSDMYWAGNRLGPTRLLGAYAWRALLGTGVIIPNGSDFPVEKVNPLISFHASVSRQDEHNWPTGGWFAEQRMTRDEALKSMTLWPAIAAFQEAELGSLAPGKLADFVVLDQDIMSVAPERILATRVLATYLAGRPVYERPPAPATTRAAVGEP
ncbi:MAG TPA: amidohydrolase, partial [Candidatus Limnocylindria bacterium]|nr:amidohydrolase [Candidatus Limnocylindria bacterium]